MDNTRVDVRTVVVPVALMSNVEPWHYSFRDVITTRPLSRSFALPAMDGRNWMSAKPHSDSSARYSASLYARMLEAYLATPPVSASST